MHKEDEPLAYGVNDAARVAGMSRSELYRAISRGDLSVRKHGRHTLVLRSELERFLLALPQGVGVDPREKMYGQPLPTTEGVSRTP